MEENLTSNISIEEYNQMDDGAYSSIYLKHNAQNQFQAENGLLIEVVRPELTISVGGLRNDTENDLKLWSLISGKDILNELGEISDEEFNYYENL